MSKKTANILDKWIFVVLSANNYEGITGRIRMTKEFFLLAKNHVPELWEVAQFYPYHFGPYSTRLAVRMNTLSKQGLVSATVHNTDWCYFLTEKGKTRANQFIDSLDSSIVETIEKLKKNYKRKSVRTILREIYENYSEYVTRSIVVPRIREELMENEELKVDDSPGFVASCEVTNEGIQLKGKAARRFLEYFME